MGFGFLELWRCGVQTGAVDGLHGRPQGLCQAVIVKNVLHLTVPSGASDRMYTYN